MNLTLFIGIPATGKSSFCRERFADSHVRLNLDMLGTRHREELLFKACIEAKARVVIDDTNLTRALRVKFIGPARAAGFSIHGWFFRSCVEEAMGRNAARPGSRRAPDVAVRGASRRLELPAYSEGFDRLHFVRIGSGGEFIVEDWKDEV